MSNARLLAGFLLAIALDSCPISRASEFFRPADPQYLSQGRYVFERNCATCHGLRGNGRGEWAAALIPAPRDFTRGIFKFRSTPSGSLPLDEDLERTVREGVAGSAMPVFGGTLTAREIHAVIQYVKSFSPKWNHRENYAPPLAIPATPDWFTSTNQISAHALSGKQIYTSNCSACHGSEGRGNGPAVTPEFLDSWGHPAHPADLHQANLRCARDPRDAYQLLLTGIDGTPMPSFAAATTEAQRWDLVAFLTQLRANDFKVDAGGGAFPPR